MAKLILTREENYTSICVGKFEPESGLVKLGLLLKNEDDYKYVGVK